MRYLFFKIFIFLKELKKAFEPNNLLLSAVVAAGIETIEKGYEIDQLSEYLDFVNVMSYVR
jgi:GH18 family chitinase